MLPIHSGMVVSQAAWWPWERRDINCGGKLPEQQVFALLLSPLFLDV